MLSPKHQRYATRLEELIQEGESVAKLDLLPDRRVRIVSFPEPEKNQKENQQKENKNPLHAWLVKVSNIIELVFGHKSAHFRHFEELTKKGVEHSPQIYPIIGILNGALDDLKKGYLLGQEFILASEVFDSVLEQATHLVQTGYKDPAAVLARIVLENSLKRLARAEGIEDTLKASKINDELRDTGRYPKVQWRMIQSWLDIGNAAAHGKFNEYNDYEVKQSIKGIERFLADEFRT